MKEMKEVLKAMERLQDAFIECADAFCEEDEGELDDLISAGYPFGKSFDEMALEVTYWVEDVKSGAVPHHTVIGCWEHEDGKYWEIELAPGRFVLVKSPSPGMLYIMQNSDGTLVYDTDGNPMKDQVKMEEVIQDVIRFERASGSLKQTVA